MTNYQSAKLASYKLIVYESEIYADSVALIPKFKAGLISLKAVCSEAEEIQTMQEKDLTGVAEDKHQILTQLIDLMVEISGALQSYAREMNNNELHEITCFSESSIHRLKHAEIRSAANLLNTEIDKLSPEECTAEGISPEDLAEFTRLYEEFSDNLQAPRKAILKRSGLTGKLSNLFNEAANLKRDVLDNLVVQFKRKDPEFYAQYMAAANVINTGSHKSSNGESDSEENNTTEEIKE